MHPKVEEIKTRAANETGIKDRIARETTLAYLAYGAEPVSYTTKNETKVTTHGKVIDRKLIQCMEGSETVPAGTEGYLFKNVDRVYDQYVTIGDERYPTEDANIIKTITYYTFVTEVIFGSGDRVLASAFKTVES